jgi:hypothetical protein
MPNQTEHIGFDHGKARNLYNKFIEGKRVLENANNSITRELINAGQWWKGESYSQLKDHYEGTHGVKKHLDRNAEEASSTGGELLSVGDAKWNFEKDKARQFK